MIRRAAAAAGVLVVAAALAGCDDERLPLPVPSDTPTALPDVHGTPTPEAIDPRCIEQYGDHAQLVFEGEIRVRPDGWPAPADFAVLCRVVTHSDTEQTGHYALSYYTSFDTVVRHYESTFQGGHHGMAPTDDGEILTGVLPPASYYIESTGTGTYAIHWAIDGDWRP